MYAKKTARNAYVDRIRGFASLAVVLSHASGYVPFMLFHLTEHARVSVAANGYHGVTVFFVISGFLITGKILTSSDVTGRFSLRTFYVHRVGRIAPCLFLFIAVACAIALTGIPNTAIDWPRFPETLWVISTFRFNLVLNESLASPQTFMPIVPRFWDPLWSLSVEEVFYLCWPVLLLLVRRRALIVAGLAGLVVFGPISRAATASPYPYLSNFDAMAMGAMVAIMAPKVIDWKLYHRACRWLRYLGLATILATFWITQDTYAVLTWAPSVVGLGTALYLLGSLVPGESSSWALWPLERFGILSYEVYLFHLPLLTVIYPLTLQIATMSGVSQQIGLSYLATATYLVALLVGSQLVATAFSVPANRAIRHLLDTH